MKNENEHEFEYESETEKENQLEKRTAVDCIETDKIKMESLGSESSTILANGNHKNLHQFGNKELELLFDFSNEDSMEIGDSSDETYTLKISTTSVNVSDESSFEESRNKLTKESNQENFKILKEGSRRGKDVLQRKNNQLDKQHGSAAK
ncbi:DgyrCDS11255 [Dimorphilus gyrociliatus]|uniref:DgyrCDS11255 n=1 Tax=Dimorphilus gyrociliatus TaxID=2664684 RepID=A0A7I8W595_9ANNE|nr:DgyrCDS11255 [Dimorphilus gyrociliatus]